MTMLVLCSLFQSLVEHCLLQYSSGEALQGSDNLLCSQSRGLPVLAMPSDLSTDAFSPCRVWLIKGRQKDLFPSAEAAHQLLL